jgi:hypothetical protein
LPLLQAEQSGERQQPQQQRDALPAGRCVGSTLCMV